MRTDRADGPQLADFWDMPAAQRGETVLAGVARAHAWHLERNRAYRRVMSARGVGEEMAAADLPRLLRPTAQTFKSYIEVLGTPFPHDRPRAFLEWLADQLSLELPRERFSRFRPRYRSLEAFLRAIEREYSDLGLEVLTSSGTSGRASVIVRDGAATDATVESFYLCFQRYLGMKADHRAIFLMPRRTRIAMARMAHFSVERVGLTADRVHFAIPFPAYPDQVRVRTGRTFRPGWRGALERRLWHPAIGRLQERLVNPQATRKAVTLLERAAASGEKALLFGSLVQLHGLALALRGAGRTVALAPGSLLGSGGGIKELYPATPAEIRHDLAQAIRLTDGRPVPIRDVYGMAEANWAAMQCAAGNYHVPPWVRAVTLDDDDRLQTGDETTGLLAFFDPFGGGRLFPAFFRTADRLTLVAGEGSRVCACGQAGAYIAQDSIQRVDLLDEAGCAAQV